MTGAQLYDSISEGCYLILPQSSRKGEQTSVRRTATQKKRIVASNSAIVDDGNEDNPSPDHFKHDGFRRLFCDSEPEESLKLRHKMCQHAIRELEHRVKALLLDINQNTLTRLAAFVEHAHPQLDSSEGDAGFSSIFPPSIPFNEIPTALVFAGVNIPDHDVLFRQISKHIRTQTNHSVAVLESKDCTTLRNMMKSMISQLLGNCNLDDDEGDEYEVEDEEGSGKVISDGNQQKQSTYTISPCNIRSCKTPPYDLQILEGWYAQQSELQSKEPQDGEIGSRRNRRRNLVVIVQDFECFSPEVLEDFVTICSSYYPRLPITLFFGIATSIEAMHQMLPQAALSLLRTEKFNLSNAEGGVGALVDEFLIKPTSGLKMSYGTYKMLSENFFLHNMSLTSFARNIKYALMDHFYADPLSILPRIISGNADQLQKMVTADHLECVRMQKSFICYVEGLVHENPTEARQLVTSNDHLRSRLPYFIHRLHDYHEKFAFAFEVLDTMQKQVSKALNTVSLKKARRIIYLYALDRSMVETDFFQGLLKLLRKLDIHDFLSLMTQCGNVLENDWLAKRDSRSEDAINPEGRLNPHVSTWNAVQTIIAQLQTLLQCVGDPNATTHATNENAESIDDEETVSQKTKNEISSRRKRSRSRSDDEADLNERRLTRRKLAEQTKEEALAAAKMKAEMQVGYAKVVDDALNVWQEFFRLNMPHYSTIPLHELVFYSHTRLLSRAFNAQPRAAIQTALGHPSHYLDCECCQAKGGSEVLHPSLPDATIAYQIYLDFSRMINMYDWFVTFGMVLEREKRRPDTKVADPKKAGITKTSVRRGESGKKRQTEEEHEQEKNGEKKEEDEGKKFQQEVQSRFIRAVAELQFLGFIRPTNRKTDHFIRCTWGRGDS